MLKNYVDSGMCLKCQIAPETEVSSRVLSLKKWVMLIHCTVRCTTSIFTLQSPSLGLYVVSVKCEPKAAGRSHLIIYGMFLLEGGQY